jgi:CCR4-NOT transcriptional complex subunit CAF120
VKAALVLRCVTLTAAGGRPALDRVWQECFAQLVGTILSLWDASELDNVKSDTEVLPTFINLTDAAIHMVRECITVWRLS